MPNCLFIVVLNDDLLVFLRLWYLAQTVTESSKNRLPVTVCRIRKGTWAYPRKKIDAKTEVNLGF